MTSRQPFEGLTFCCTGVQNKLRREINKYVKALGGIQYDDLMTDVQYLIVGSRDTPKYQFCVKNRLDIVFLAEDAVSKIYKSWLLGEEVDQLRLDEHKLPIFANINACLSRTDLTQSQIVKLFEAAGGFRGDAVEMSYFNCNGLTHLLSDHGGSAKESLLNDQTCMISADPRGTRYNKAIEWKIPVVHPIWVYDSLLRGAALDYNDYTLSSNNDEIYANGCTVWESLVEEKRKRKENKEDLENKENSPPRKRKLVFQSTGITKDVPKMLQKTNNREIWDSIMDRTKAAKAPIAGAAGAAVAEEEAVTTTVASTRATAASASEQNKTKKDAENQAWDEESENENIEDVEKLEQKVEEQEKKTAKSTLFLGFNFLLVGFDSRESNLLSGGIEGYQGEITKDVNDDSITHIIIPAKRGSRSSSVLKPLPSTLKQKITNSDVKVVTEFFIEKSIYYKKVVLDTWGQPIKGLMPSTRKFQVSTSGFTGIELLHIEKLIKFMNFEYCDTLSKDRDILILNVNLFKESFMKNSPKLFEYKNTDILNCPVYQSGGSSVSLLSAKNKIEACKKWSIPVVSLAYLWEIFELSKYKSEMMMPELTNSKWCIYAPINNTRPRSLMEYLKSMSDFTSTKPGATNYGDLPPKSKSVSDRIDEDTDDGLVKLPSPRKITPRKKYGRLVGRSPQSIRNKLVPSRENSVMGSVYENRNEENGDITRDEDFSLQVRYEDTTSMINQERLLKKLEHGATGTANINHSNDKDKTTNGNNPDAMEVEVENMEAEEEMAANASKRRRRTRTGSKP